jgi:TonB family protein
VPPVPGVPFSATVECVSQQKLADGSVIVLKTRKHIARDSTGRTHNESRKFVAPSYAGESPLTEIQLYDPGTKLDTHLDPLMLIARQTRKTKPPEPSVHSVPDPNPNTPASLVKQVKDLGNRDFEGISLQGTLQSEEDGSFTEFWYSPKFSLYMSRRHEDAVWKQTVEVTEFHAQEPDPSDFAIPPGYKVVEVQDTLPLPDIPGVYHVGNGVLAPELIHSVDPEYTMEARRNKYQGVCVVSLVVDEHGKPQNIQVVRHLEKGLDHSAVVAVSKYQFKPATLNGRPVPVQVEIMVRFRVY